MIGETLLAPRPGPGVCVDCFTFTPSAFSRCLACQRSERHLSAVAPIAYSVADGSLHRDIRSYKRDADPSVDQAVNRLAGLLSRFMPIHEPCLATACRVDRFDLVTTVPSAVDWSGVPHPLERIVGTLVPATSGRYERLLRRSESTARPRRFDARRFAALRSLDGCRVLMIDDMWTSGSTAQSAAAALREAGALVVGVVVIARHLGRRWSKDGPRLQALAAPLEFGECAHCAGRMPLTAGRRSA